jgi:exoribonuclease-2
MNIFYEEEGTFKIGSVMADNVASLQVEALHGKRSKIKADKVLLKFELPLAGFMEAAQDIAADMDLDFLWECCGEDEFSFADLGKDYFGHAPSPIEAAGLLLKLHGAPMYFYKKGKGKYKAATAETLKLALASEEKRRQALVLAEHAALERRVAGLHPEIVGCCISPTKNSLEFKALDRACETAHLTPAVAGKCGIRFARFPLQALPVRAFPRNKLRRLRRGAGNPRRAGKRCVGLQHRRCHHHRN